jgi:hypothetical protein
VIIHLLSWLSWPSGPSVSLSLSIWCSQYLRWLIQEEKPRKLYETQEISSLYLYTGGVHFESLSSEGKSKITVTVWNFMTSNIHLIEPQVSRSHRNTFRNGHFPNMSVRLIVKPTCCRGLTTVSVVARPQGEQPTTIFYLFGHFTPYAYARNFLAEVTILCNRAAFQDPGGSVK